MGCSHFHMFREYPTRSAEYDRLRIPKETEKEWTQEQFDEYYAQIMENAPGTCLWVLHSSMESLLYTLHSQDALMKMLEVTQFMRDLVPVEDWIIVAETILGRTVRSARQGLIYTAYDWKNKPAAKAFVELAFHFAKYDEQHNRGYERCVDAIKLCFDIRTQLGL